MLTKRILAAALAVTMTAAFLGGCGSESEDKDSKKSETTSAAAQEDGAKDEKTDDAADGELKAPVNDGKVDLSKGATENMYTRAIFNRGDTSRLASKLKAAIDLKNDDSMEAPEKAEHSTKIAFLGDSITAGSQAATENQYTNVITSWWDQTISYFWNANNAGIGATDSYLAVHRVDDEVLAEQPDIIFIEFINDVDNDFYKSTMDSLVRKCLSQPNNPAVIMIEMTMEDGTCPQNVHTEIGLKYDIPIISYHDAVLPEVEAGNIAWKDISPDNIHPNDVGHKMLGDMIVRFMTEIIDDLDNLDTEAKPFDESIESPTGDKYKDAVLADKNSELVNCTDAGGFTEDTSPWNFKDGWAAPEGGTATFELEFQNLGILYWMTTDGKSGTASVTIDGVECAELNADFTGGWGDYAKNNELVSFDEKGKHTVTVTVPEGQKFEILRWMIS